MRNCDAETSFSKRIEVAIRKAGGVAALARITPVSKSAIEKWRKGGADPSLSNVLAIADATGLDPAWLATGRGPSAAAPQGSGFAEGNTDYSAFVAPASSGPQEALHLPLYDMARMEAADELADLARSHGEYIASPAIAGTRDPDRLIAIRASGDSMVPTFGDGDILVADTADTRLTDGIWLFVLGDDLFAKRLARHHGGLEVISDAGDLYRPWTLGAHRRLQINLIGRIIWIGRSL